MGEWQTFKLENLARIKHGFAFKGELFSDDLSYPTVVTPGNFFMSGGFKQAKPKTYVGPVPEEYILCPNSLIITMTDLSKSGDTLGMPALVPNDGATYLHNQRIGLVEVLDPRMVESRYLNYRLRMQDYRDHVLATASGSTVRHTSPSRILRFETRLPALREQTAISQVLGCLDDKIAANRRAMASAKKLAQNLVSGLQIDEHCVLGEVVSNLRLQVVPAALDASHVEHYSLPAYDANQFPSIEVPQDIKSAKYLVKTGAVLFSKLNPHNPRIWLVKPSSAFSAVASTEFVVMAPEGISLELLWVLSAHPLVTERLVSLARGTSNSHQRVSPSEILHSPIPNPREIPVQVVHEVENLVRLAESYQREIPRLERLGEALLPKLMDGTLTVHAAEDLVSDAV